MTPRIVVAVPLLVSAAACARVGVPGPLSPEPRDPSHSTVRAGFGKADITPPPGAGLFGYGPEGKVARGFRHRLHARALVIEDARGEKVALVTVDLGAISVLVQRRAAELTRTEGIGADRLFVAATHTHSGPGHYFALSFDHFGSERYGFDTQLVDLLATGIADAVTAAARSLRPARLAWAIEPVWGRTRNRDVAAFRLNQPTPHRYVAPAGLTPEQAAVDPTWTLLRVDLLDQDRGIYRPSGAFSVFAMHGTGNPSANDLYDGDMHSIVERALERHIDGLNGVSNDSTIAATHLFANGTEGDVSPDWPAATRCPLPQLAVDVDFDRPLDYAKLIEPSSWTQPDSSAISACLSASRDYINQAGDALGNRVIAMFDALQPTDSTATVARVFEHVRLRGGQPGGICGRPEVGTATPSGVADGITRYRVAGVPFVEEGGTALDFMRGDCQWPKRTLLGDAQRLLTDLITSLPENAQFGIVRIGPVVLATVPAEITTTAGARVRHLVRTALTRDGELPDSVTVVGLTNGYLYYVTTHEEYALQHYAGSSTIYGPHTASLFSTILYSMAGRLPSAGEPSPPAELHGYSLRTGRFLFGLLSGSPHVIPSADEGPARATYDSTMQCTGDTITVRWRDVYPGRLFRRPYPLIAIQMERAGVWISQVWDDDRNLEFRADSADGDLGHWYSVKWKLPVRPTAGTRFRTRLPNDGGPTRFTAQCSWAPA